MSEVMKPGAKDTISIRKIPATKKDRKELQIAFRKQKEDARKQKEERFAAILERRKNKPGSSGGSGGINIEVTSDS